ncbi:MAG: hypothetical protein IKT40_01330 [Bacilli bacterium]|nr:hypothetical protein [Bacilli bacterium]
MENLIKKDCTTIYVVVRHIIVDSGEVEFDSKPFLNKEDAFNYFKSIVDEELVYANKKEWIIETNTNDEFCAYEDGYYATSHSCIKIEEHII